MKRLRADLIRTLGRLSRGATLAAVLAAVLAVTALSPIGASADTHAHPASTAGNPAPDFGMQQAAGQSTDPAVPAHVRTPRFGAAGAASYPVERTVPVSVHGIAAAAVTARFLTGPLGPAVSSLCGVKGINRTRHAACGVVGIAVTVRQLPSKKVVGTGLVGFLYSEALNNKSRHWGLQAEISLIKATGVLKADAIATTRIVCTGGCASSGPWTKLRLSQGKIYSHTFSISSPGSATHTTHQTPVITFAHPISENVAPVVLRNLGPARCDSIAVKGSSGCVFSDKAAEYFVYLTGHNEDAVAANVERGERSKPAHFGWFGHGSPLTRATSSSVAAANRRAACGKKNFKPLTCDEYPFAATFQGAKFFPADNVTAGVPGSQNSAEGALRVAMYRSERLLNEDPYWVFVKP